MTFRMLNYTPLDP